MRSRTKLLLLVGLATSSLALIHCVGDEPSGSTSDDAGGGGDSGTPDNFIPPGDSGPGDAGADAGLCSAAAEGLKLSCTGSGPCIVQISGGGQTFCARDINCNGYCWGDNRDGQLGNPSAGAFSAKPVRIAVTKPVFGVNVGGPLDLSTDNASVACALLGSPPSPVTVACWGANAHGQLARGDAGGSDPNPQEIPGLSGIAHIAVGPTHACAYTTVGVLYCWGEGDHGELGRDAGPAEATYTAVPGAIHTEGAVAGSQHTCLIDSSNTVTVNGNAFGQVECFGANQLSQLGRDSGTQPSDVPTALVLSAGGTLHGPGMDTSGFTSCALSATDQVACWGGDDLEQVGNGLKNDAGVEPPYFIPSGSGFPTSIVAVSVGFHHTCAISGESSNNVYCWGSDDHGQAGQPNDGGPLLIAAPTQVMGLPLRAVELATASQASCAILTDGSVWCWGENYQGELGDRDDGGNDQANLAPGQIQFE